MAGSAAPSRIWRTPVWIALAGAAAFASGPLQAQPCAGPLGEKATDSLERFSMISAQCAPLASVPMTVHRAAQLDLYERPVLAVTIAPPAGRLGTGGECSGAAAGRAAAERARHAAVARPVARDVAGAGTDGRRPRAARSTRCCCTPSRTSNRVTTRAPCRRPARAA